MNTVEKEVVCPYCKSRSEWGVHVCKSCGAKASYQDGSLTTNQSFCLSALIAFIVAQFIMYGVPYVVSKTPLINSVVANTFVLMHGVGEAHRKANVPTTIVSDDEFEKVMQDFKVKKRTWRNEHLKTNQDYIDAYGLAKMRRPPKQPVRPNIISETSRAENLSHYALSAVFIWVGVIISLFVFWKVHQYFLKPKMPPVIVFKN